ncbi:hypothetical protein Ancab_006793 [Ancistrocladus abbreviatus]
MLIQEMSPSGNEVPDNYFHKKGDSQADKPRDESSFLDETREASKRFFGLPLEEKRKCSGTRFEGYGTDEKDNWNDQL